LRETADFRMKSTLGSTTATMQSWFLSDSRHTLSTAAEVLYTSSSSRD
jgi:hypothetical protein